MDDKLKNFKAIAVSEEEPIEKNTSIWINPNAKESFSMPEIDDNSENENDTWSSKKISGEINELKGDLGYIFENNSIPFGETITYSFDSLPVYKEGYYINGNGEVISDVHNKILRIPSNGIKKISITAAESQNVYTSDFVIALNKDGSFYERFLAGNRMVAGNTYSATLNRLAYDFTTILYINWLYYNDETYTFNDSIIIEYFTEDEYLKTLTAGKRDMFSSDVPLCALDFYKGGKYIDNYGEEQTHNTASIMRISADNVDKISVIMEEGHNIYPSDTTPLAVVKDKNGELTQILRCSSQGIFELTIDHDTCVNGTIYLNYYDSYGKKKQWNSEFGSDVYVPNFINITWAKTIKSQSFEFKNYLKRPFNFSGAVIEYIGDSITEGVINTNPIEYTTETYPKLFSNAVNALSYVNHGKAGACYISGLNSGVKTMLEQIQDITTTPDIIFVAGGTNDWLMGGNISDIRTALSDVCNYIKSNFPNSNVIFITPINESGWQGPPAANPTATLQTFRNAISEEIIKADIGKFSILQGNSFNFPTIESDSTYADSVIYDRLHPTELGYTNVYVTGLLNYLT